MQALVLAGRANRGLLKEYSSSAYEGEIFLAGRRMADYVLDAIQSVPEIEQIAVVGPRSLHRDGIILVEPSEDLLENVLHGFDAVMRNPRESVLVVTTDVPLLTPEVIRTFLRQASTRVDFVYPIVSKDAVRQVAPTVDRTFVRLKEGVFTGGNIFLIKPEAFIRAQSRVEMLLSYRKSPLKLAKYLGLGLLFQLLMGTLTINRAVVRGQEVLDITSEVLIFPCGEAGIDVDKVSDLKIVEDILKKSAL